MKYLFGTNEKLMGQSIKKYIAKFKSDTRLNYAVTAQKYYEFEHDILKHRIFYIDETDTLREDKHASNVRIPHPFFTEIVDQGVQYLLSNPLEVEVSEDNELGKYLDEYINESFQRFLQEILEGASIKGKEFAFARTNYKDILEFQVSSSLNTIIVKHDDGRSVTIRFWEEKQDKKIIKYAELWNDKEVHIFKSIDSKPYLLDDSVVINPRPHIIADAEDGTVLSRSYDVNPFFNLKNNKQELSDLKPIKALIDDYDLMSSFLSNNLHDFTDAIFVVKGYEGENLSKLRQNLKSRKVVKTEGDSSGVDVKTVQIPTEARVKKLDIDKEAIYKFGMALDSTQVGDGNITNVVIRSRYALLDLKANKKEVRLNELVRWCLKLIVEDINRRYNTAFDDKDISFKFIRESVIDSKEIAEIELIETQVKESAVQTILAVAGYIDEETILRQICEQFELEYDEVQKRMDTTDHKPLDIGIDDENI